MPACLLALFSLPPRPPLATLTTFYAPVQPYNLLHTLRSIALKFKWHALAKHFNQRSRHAPSGQGGGRKRGGRGAERKHGSTCPWAAMRKKSFASTRTLGTLLVSCTYSNNNNSNNIFDYVCVWAVRVGVAFVTSRMHSNSLEKHKSIRAQPCRTVLK